MHLRESLARSLNESHRMTRMGGIQRQGETTSLPTQSLVPQVQQFGEREIEITYLGENTQGRPTWIMWNHKEPHLIGLLTQGRLGFDFEQRTSAGVFFHENISLNRLNRALTA